MGGFRVERLNECELLCESVHRMSRYGRVSGRFNSLAEAPVYRIHANQSDLLPKDWPEKT